MERIRFYLILLFIFILPWENVLMSDDGGTASKFLGIIVAGFWVLTVLVTKRMRAPLPVHVVMFLFAIWNLVSILWSVDPERSFERAQTYIQVVFLVYIMWDGITDASKLALTMKAYIVGAYITAGSTLYSYINATQYYYNRYAASGFNPNDASLIMALGLPLAWHFVINNDEQRASLWFRLLALSYLPCAFYAIFLTGSRGSLVAAIVTGLFMAATFRQLNIRAQIALAAVSLVAIYGVAVVVPRTSLDRIENKGVSLNGREEVWSQVIDVINERPILGVGSASVKTVIDRQQAAHDFALSVMSETGVFGLILFSAILLLVLSHAWRHEHHYRYLWISLVLVWVVGSSVHNFEHRKQTWLIFTYVIVSSGATVTEFSSFRRRGLIEAPA